MKTKILQTGYQLFQPQKHTPSGYESFPAYVEEDSSKNSLVLDSYELPNAEDIQVLQNLAREINDLYTLLDARHHIFTYAAVMLEKLFTMHHQAIYGDYLTRRNFTSEVERFSRVSELVTYVPKRCLPKGAVIELDSMVSGAPSSSSSASSSNQSPTSSSTGRAYGR